MIVPLLIMLLASTFLLSQKMPLVKAEARTITISADGTAMFHKIQDGINNASAGDTVFVYAGTYNESVEVNKSISLVGEDRDLTIIDGGSSSFAAQLTANQVNVRNFTMRKSILTPSDYGLLVVSSHCTITHNKITGAYEGVAIYLSRNNTISDNIITSNSNDGVLLSFSYNNVLSDNIITYNYVGMSLSLSSNNVFSGNTISNNYQGLSIISHSSYNTFYHNNFYDGVDIANDSLNVWDLNGEGNFWRNYTGSDLNEDGIGDVYYMINPSNRDYYPLSGAYSSFSVSIGHETYRVAIISNSTISGFKFEIGEETGNKLIRYNVAGAMNATGFSRVHIPSRLMNYSNILLVGDKEISPKLLDSSDTTYIRLYFTYSHADDTVLIISSKMLSLYNELLEELESLQETLQTLNATYNELLANYTTTLRLELSSMNDTYHDFLGNYAELLASFQQLQQDSAGLNTSYHEHLSNYSTTLQNLQSLTYVFLAGTAIFLATTAYLSRQAHVRTGRRPESGEKTAE